MGKVFGKVTDAIGLTDYEGQEKAAKNANAANAQALALTKEQIAFQKEQYADWKNVYGDLQKNLGEYYKNLTGEKITALGLQNQQAEYQRAVTALEEEATQRGISGSGMEFAVKSNLTFNNAEARARIRTESDQKVAEQKLGFLGVGLGQGTQMLGIIGNAYNTGINARTNTANNYMNQYTNLSSNNTGFVQGIAGTAAGYYLPAGGGNK